MRNKIIIIALVVISSLIIRLDSFGQANKTRRGEVTCPASGTSIEVLAANAARYSYTLNNTSGIDVRIGYLDSGTAALTTSTGWLLKAGQPYTDSVPGVLQNRVVCMSTTAGTAVINYLETYR